MKIPSLIPTACLALCAVAWNAAAEPPVNAKPRVIALTDLSNEPDDEGSLVRFLVYANESDVEGIIATTGVHLKAGPREDIIRRDLEAYEKVLPNLSKHSTGYPSVEHLRSLDRIAKLLLRAGNPLHQLHGLPVSHVDRRE